MPTNFMQLALSQAFFAIGESRPNPAVGAIVVKDGIIVGKGRTQRPGNAHAEVMALRDARELAHGANLYVTLEPCCHYGRTPPCTSAIIDAGIKQVFFAHSDPNPMVRGKSRSILESAGIKVYEGIEACIGAQFPEESFSNESNYFHDKASIETVGRYIYNDIERFYEAYNYFVCNKRTFVEVKCAISEDGFIGMVCSDGSHAPLKITAENADCWNHELRSMSDAVLVGAGTLLADNPCLEVRYVQGNNPIKIVWASHHEFIAEEIEKLSFFSPSHTIERLVFSCVPQPAISNTTSFSNGLEVIYLTGMSFAENWHQMITHLSERGLHRLMVEPGAGLMSQLFQCENDATLFNKSPLWNRLDIWQSSDSSVEKKLDHCISLGTVIKGLEFPGLPKNIIAKESAMVGSDVLTTYYPILES